MDIITEIKRAIDYTKNQDYKSAEKIYKSILKTDKNNLVVFSALGLLYLNLGKFKQAEKYLEKVCNEQPNLAAMEGLGLVKFYLNQNNEACDIFEKIIDKTNNFDVYDKYVTSLLSLKRNTEGYKYAKIACTKFPLRKEAYNNLIFSCIPNGKLIEGFNTAQQLLKRYPDYGQAWENLGLLYEMLFFDDDMARECYKKVLKYGDKSAGYYNLAINASKKGYLNKALYYAKKVKVNSGDKSFICFMLSTMYFKQRKFNKAYKYYIQKEKDAEPSHITYKLKNLWDGKIYKDETLLVYCDQGIGDCIMFSRYLPFLQKKFKKIKVILPKSIYNLFKHSYKAYTNIEFYEFKKRIPKYDKYTVQSNLPYYLKMPLDNIPSSDGYIVANDSKIDKYHKIIKSDKLKIGLVWEAGGIGWRELLQRTLNITIFEPLLNIENVEYYSLQVKPSMDNYKNYKNIIDIGSTFEDFDDTAGALMNLDLIITVDTSVAHLAGALGKKTFMLLPYVTDWRWFDNDKTTEWYDSIKIFKQTSPRSWDDVIENIKKEIERG